jgi:hypothetical protein
MLGRTAGYEISFFPAGKNKCNLKIRQNAALADPSSLQRTVFQHFLHFEWYECTGSHVKI